MADPAVVAKIAADITELKAELNNAVGEIRKFGKRVKEAEPKDSFQGLGKGLKDLAKVGAVVAPLVVAGKTASDFESSMRNVNSIAHLSEKDFAALSEQVRTLNTTLGVSSGPKELAEGLYDVVSSGFQAEDAVKVLGAAAQAADAGLTDTKTASAALVGALNAYGQGADQAARFSDVLFSTVNTGVTTFPELAQSLGQVTSIAANSGISFEELTAAIAALTVKGVKTPEAITGIKMAIAQLAAPTEQSKKALASIGLTAEEVTKTLKGQGLGAALNQVFKASGGNKEVLRQVFGDVAALNAAFGLAADGGEKFADAFQANMTAAGTTAATSAEQGKSSARAYKEFQGALESAQIALAQGFLPVMTSVVHVATDAINVFNGLPGPLQQAIGWTAALGAGMVTAGTAVGQVKGALSAFGLGVQGVSKVAPAAAKSLDWMASAAQGGTQAMGLAGPAATNAAGGVRTLGVALTAAQASALLFAAAIAGIVAVGVLAIKTTQEWNKTYEEQGKYIKQSAHELRALHAAMNDTLGGKTAEDLNKAGVSSQELTERMIALRAAIEDTQQAMDKGLLDRDLGEKRVAQLRAKIGETADKRKELVQVEQEQAVAAKQRADAEAAAAAKEKQAAAEGKAAWENFKKRASADFYASKQEELKALDEVRAKTKVGTKERAEADLKRVALARDAAAEQQKLAKESQEKEFDTLKHGLDKEEALGQVSAATRVGHLRQVLATHTLTTEQRRELEMELARATKQAEDDKLQAVKKSEEQKRDAAQATAQHAKELAEVQKSAADQEIQDLEKRRAKGENVQADIEKQIKDRTKAEEEAARHEGEAAKAGAKTAAERADIEKVTQARVEEVRRKGELELKQSDEDAVKDASDSASKRLELQQRLTDQQIQSLEFQRNSGKDVHQEWERLQRQKLDQTIQQIQLEAEAAKAATSDATERAAIDVDASNRIKAARLDAAGVIGEERQKLEELKKTKDSLLGKGDFTTGGIQSIEQMAADLAGQPSSNAPQKGGDSSQAVMAGLNALGIDPNSVIASTIANAGNGSSPTAGAPSATTSGAQISGPGVVSEPGPSWGASRESQLGKPEAAPALPAGGGQDGNVVGLLSAIAQSTAQIASNTQGGLAGGNSSNSNTRGPTRPASSDDGWSNFRSDLADAQKYST